MNNSEAFNSNVFEVSSGQFEGLTFFRNNCGMLYDNSGTPVYYGVGGPTQGKKSKGGSDYIGWESVVITPEMVGHRVAIFCAFELKKDEADTKTDIVKTQEHFIETVNKAGGKAGFVKRPIDTELILQRQGCVKLSEYPRDRLGE